jgi:hypothetical protein
MMDKFLLIRKRFNSAVRLTCALTVISFTFGCAQVVQPKQTLRFSGPGEFQDFAKARYQCLQETKTVASGAFINQFGGASTTNVAPSCSSFDACLAAKGYYRNPNGNLDASSIPINCR